MYYSVLFPTTKLGPSVTEIMMCSVKTRILEKLSSTIINDNNLYVNLMTWGLNTFYTIQDKLSSYNIQLARYRTNYLTIISS